MEVAVALLALLSLATIGLALLSRRAASRAEEHVKELEAHDLLTGLPARGAVVDALTGLLPGARPGSPVAVAVLELHRFGAVNETYGHEAGDALLAAVGRRLGAARRPDEVAGRLSGPQFVVAGTGSTDAAQARRRAGELLAAVTEPVRVGSDTIRVRAGVGVALADRADVGADVLLADATTAVHAAHDGPTHVAVFEPAMQRTLPPTLAEETLRRALDEEQFWLFFLPVVELGTNRLVGTEALLRWADPAQGVSEPERFLEALEASGLIVPAGRWAIRTACRQAVDWRRRHPGSDLTMTVNVSPRQILHPEFTADLETILSETQLPPDALCLEIAGGSTVYDVDGVRLAVGDAKALGVQVALDDFGVGLASLDYVRRLDIDVVKVERAFVDRLTDSREDRAIVEQLVGLGQALGITTVAEGVDSSDQAEALLAMGCDLAQGYLWMSPQPPDALDAVIQRGRILPGATDAPAVDWTGTA